MVKTPLYVKVITGVVATVYFFGIFLVGPYPGPFRIFLLVMTPVLVALPVWRLVRMFRGLDEMSMVMRFYFKNTSRAHVLWICIGVPLIMFPVVVIWYILLFFNISI